MVSVEHAKGEDMEKTLSHTIAPRNWVEFNKNAVAIYSDTTSR